MVKESVMDHLTTAGAGAAIMSPWWLPALHNGAEFALPFLGCSWLLIQIYYKIKKERNSK